MRVFFFQKYFAVHNLSAVKNSCSTYVECYTLLIIFYWQCSVRILVLSTVINWNHGDHCIWGRLAPSFWTTRPRSMQRRKSPFFRGRKSKPCTWIKSFKQNSLGRKPIKTFGNGHGKKLLLACISIELHFMSLTRGNKLPSSFLWVWFLGSNQNRTDKLGMLWKIFYFF